MTWSRRPLPWICVVQTSCYGTRGIGRGANATQASALRKLRLGSRQNAATPPTRLTAAAIGWHNTPTDHTVESSLSTKARDWLPRS